MSLYQAPIREPVPTTCANCNNPIYYSTILEGWRHAYVATKRCYRGSEYDTISVATPLPARDRWIRR